jgi:hypothetical protein
MPVGFALYGFIFGPLLVRGLVRQRSGFHRICVPSDCASSTVAATVSNLRHTVP